MATEKNQAWPELAERVLRAAQDAVNDSAECTAGGQTCVHAGSYIVDKDTMDELKSAVQAVHEDAVKTIEREIELAKLEEHRERNRCKARDQHGHRCAQMAVANVPHVHQAWAYECPTFVRLVWKEA